MCVCLNIYSYPVIKLSIILTAKNNQTKIQLFVKTNIRKRVTVYVMLNEVLETNMRKEHFCTKRQWARCHCV